MPTHAKNTEYPDNPRTALLSFIPPGARRILDIGCWQGAFGQALKETRPDVAVFGVESNQLAADKAAERLDEVTVGSFPDALPQGKYDCITFNDVLEHIVDPWAALRISRDSLSPGGCVVATIPNIRHVRALVPLLVKGRWDYTDTGLLDRTHVRFFTRSTMFDLFETSGYTVASSEPLDISRTGLSGIILRILSALFGRKTGTEFFARHYVVVARPA